MILKFHVPLIMGLLFWVPYTLLAQIDVPTPRPPADYGGNRAKTLDLRNSRRGTLTRIPVYDYVKFNPRYRSLIPSRRKCITPEQNDQLQAKHAGETVNEFERWLERRNQASRNLRRRSIETYTLPTVVHVIYSNPTENISEAQIRSQIQTLNEDYRRRNPDAANTPPNFVAVSADAQIEFCLATVDPEGRPTSGIDRVSISGSPFTDQFINEVIKPNTVWDPTRYVNIWVCNIRGGILGYAQFPSSTNLAGLPSSGGISNTDGVVVHYNAFGTMGTANPPFNRGRTATHEMGHWLGLRHIWGDGDCGVDDYCADTPPTAQANFGCALTTNGCFSRAMVQNYMDYSDDACMNLFTRDQRDRMRTVLENAPRRRELLNATTCRADAVPPVVDFRADIQYGCGPLLVNFKSSASGNPTEYAWSFPGGTPATSTQPNPSVTYTSAGVFPVTLVVRNAAGSSPPLTKTNYITVVTEGRDLPLQAGAEDGIIPPPNFFTLDLEGEKYWNITQRISAYGQGSGTYWFNNYDNNLIGSLDWMLSPVLDFTEGNDAYLAFDVAYAAYSVGYTDSLAILVSTACDPTFRTIYLRGGSQLATTSQSFIQQPFAPAPDEWRTEVIDLSDFDGQNYVQFAFVNISGYGNNLFIDNIRIAQKPKPIPEPAFRAQNPTVCAGSKVAFVNLTENARSLSWSFPGGIPATDTSRTPLVTYPQPGNYDVLLTATNASGSKTATLRGYIAVKAASELEISPKSVTVCRGATQTFTASGATTYQWAPNRDILENLGTSIRVKAEQNLAYTVTGTDANGCTATATAQLIVNEADGMRLQPAEARICRGESVELSVSGVRQVRWEPSLGLRRSSGLKTVARPDTTTTYTVRGTTDAGCKIQREITVLVDEAPTLYVGASKTRVCAGEEVLLRTAGGGRYRWFREADTEAEIAEGDQILVAPTQTTTYRVSRVDAEQEGCAAQAQVTIEVLPSANIEPEQQDYRVCRGSTVNLSASGAPVIQWNTNEGLPITRGNTIPAAPRETTIYQVIGSTESGCADTAYVQVTVLDPPVVELRTDRPTLCPGTKATLVAEGADTYFWAPTEGLTNSTGAVVEAQPAQSTRYTVTGFTNQGCQGRASVRIDVSDENQPVSAAFTVENRTVCAGAIVQFEDRSRRAVRYRWRLPGATPPVSTDQNPKVIYQQPGTYDATLLVVGCGSTDSLRLRRFITVTEAGRLEVADTEIRLCAGENAQLRASGMQAYRWRPALGLSATTGESVLASPQKDIIYSVTGIDKNGCTDEANVNVRVRGGTNFARIQNRTQVVCAGDTLRLSASEGERFVWKNARTSAALATGKIVDFLPLESTTYRLEVADESGCTYTDSLRVTVRQRPDARLHVSDSVVCPGELVRLVASGGIRYDWPQQAHIDRAEGEIALASPDQSTTFRVRVTGSNGCRTTATAQVQVSSARELDIFTSAVKVCLGDTLRLAADGGDDYRWVEADGLVRTDDGVAYVSPTQTTTYQVVSNEAKGCPAVGAVTIGVYAPETLRAFPENQLVCRGEAAQLRASNGSNLVWFDARGQKVAEGDSVAIPAHKTTTYTLRGRDAQGCRAEGAATVRVRAVANVGLSASASAICLGESVEVGLAEGTLVRWIKPDSSFTSESIRRQPDETTTYSALLRDSSDCTDTAAVTVQVEQLVVDFVMSAQAIDLAQRDGAVKFSNRTFGENLAFRWNFGEGSVSEQADPMHIYAETGTYEVSLYAANNVCEAEVTKTLVVNNSSSIREILSGGRIRVYPETTRNGKITFEIKSDREMRLRYRLIGSEGNSMLSDIIDVPEGRYRQEMDLSFFSPGKYVLQITDGDEVFSQEVIYE